MDITKDITFTTNLFEGEKATLIYKGYLFKANSTDVSIVYGYGKDWENTKTVPMERTLMGFIVELEIEGSGELNFCFKNSYNEWDNNFYQNFTAKILPPIVVPEEEASLSSINEKPDILNQILNEYSEKIAALPDFDMNEYVDKIIEDIIEEASDNTEEIDMVPDAVEESTEISDIVNAELAEESSEEREFLDDTDSITATIQAIEEQLDSIYNSALMEIESNQEVRDEEEATMADLEALYQKAIEVDENEVEENLIESETAYSPVAEEQSLIAADDKFVVSARSLTPFYKFFKRVKLAFIKALRVIPSILGADVNYNHDDNK